MHGLCFQQKNSAKDTAELQTVWPRILALVVPLMPSTRTCKEDVRFFWGRRMNRGRLCFGVYMATTRKAVSTVASKPYLNEFVGSIYIIELYPNSELGRRPELVGKRVLEVPLGLLQLVLENLKQGATE